MKAIFGLFLHNAALVSAITIAPSEIKVLFPTAFPTGQPDHRECATHDYDELLDPPKPTGSLEDALQSYNEEIFVKQCTATGIDKLGCAPAGYPEICGFSTAAPDGLLPAYSSHASSASSWWAERSSSALSIARECPHYWYEALGGTFLAAAWLNQTIAYAQCYDDAGITGAEPTEAKPTAKSGAGVTNHAPEETDEPDSGAEHAVVVDIIVLAASGLAAAVMIAS